jgi:hypothetical protein
LRLTCSNTLRNGRTPDDTYLIKTERADPESEAFLSAWGSIGNKETKLQMPKSATVRIVRVPKVIRRAVGVYVKGVFLLNGLQPLWDDERGKPAAGILKPVRPDRKITL